MRGRSVNLGDAERGEPRRVDEHVDPHALALSEQRFRGLFEGAGFGIVIADLDGRFVDANPVFLDLLGYTIEEVTALDIMAVTHPDDRAANRALLEQLFAGEVRSFGFEKRYIHRDGSVVHARTTVSLIRDADGAITNIAATIEDLSEVDRARDEAARTAERLVETLEAMSDAIYILDHDWNFTFLNGRAGELVRREPEALVGRNIWEEFPEAADSVLFDIYHRAIDHGMTETLDEFYYEPLDTWFAGSAYPSSSGLAVYFRDVTADRAARAELDRQAAWLRWQAELLDAASDAIVVRRPDGIVTFWSRGAERLYGWSAADAVGRDVRELLYADPRPYEAALAAVLSDGQWSGELTKRTRDGETVTIAARWTLVADHSDSDSDADAGPTAVLAISTDISEQRRIEQQLLRAQRLESIGTLAGGIAHDLNNMLSPIMLAAGLLLERVADDEDRNLLTTIESSARRGADLVGQVLSFARGVEGRRASVDLRRLLDGMASVIRDTFPKSIELDVEVPDGLDPVTADSTQIQQVLLNLVVNARDAMPSGGHLTIAARAVVHDAQYCAVTPDATPGPHVVVEVADDGLGMAPEVVERIFDPFFTTKPHGAGTGLGLATSSAIVKSHGGFMRVDSEPGRGSRFQVHLPVLPADTDGADDAALREAGTSQEAELPHGRGEVVLVVDDDVAVRSMTRQTLERHGYSVLEAGNGAEAVATFARHADAVAVVLTDMMMPIMDGPATVHAVRNIAADVPIVGASGLRDDGKVALAAAAGAEYFLPKPFTSEHLLTLLAEVLASRRRPA